MDRSQSLPVSETDPTTDKSFADVQRLLGDSLSKSASKGMSFAKQLQVGMSLGLSLSF